MVKGAPDVLLARCTSILDDGVTALTPALAKQVEDANAAMADFLKTHI